MTHFFHFHFHSCAAVSRDAGRGAGAAYGGDSGPGGDSLPTRGKIRGAASHVYAGHLPAAALLPGRAGTEAAGDGPVSRQAGQLRVPPR